MSNLYQLVVICTNQIHPGSPSLPRLTLSKVSWFTETNLSWTGTFRRSHCFFSIEIGNRVIGHLRWYHFFINRIIGLWTVFRIMIFGCKFWCTLLKMVDVATKTLWKLVLFFHPIWHYYTLFCEVLNLNFSDFLEVCPKSFFHVFFTCLFYCLFISIV